MADIVCFPTHKDSSHGWILKDGIVKGEGNYSYVYDVCREKNCENEYATLFDVKNTDDFLYWEKHVGKFMDSEPVNAVAPSSLEDLFA